jgi:hypothetical protein
MEIVKDERNYRIHDDKNKSLIQKSLDELGAGRSILLDNSGRIIAGNGVFGEWGDKPIRIIETDGDELIAVKRRDLSPDDPRRQKLAFADNHTTDTSLFDQDLLLEDMDILDLDAWGFDVSFDKESPVGNDPFADEGIKAENKFGIIVMCDSADDQEAVFNRLTKEGYNCKVVVV